MFGNLFFISAAIISTFTNFNYQTFEEKFQMNYFAKNDIPTLNIPFTPQAPFGDWNDLRQQDGCEEASVLMAFYWTQKKELTLKKAAEIILDISDFEELNFGNFADTSIEDTANNILKGYFGYENFYIKRNITVDDLILELALGYAVIIPVNGQLLENPNFSPPGPEHHMLVIKGYDKKTREFITNDPGTKMGDSYRYNQEKLLNAITDYPTGNHLPIQQIEKVMLVIRK